MEMCSEIQEVSENTYDLTNSQETASALTRSTETIKYIFQRSIGYVAELFSHVPLALMYFFPQTLLDPKKEHIKRDSKGVAIQQPILLVHGYLHNSSGWAYQRNRLNKAGFENVFTINLGAIPNKGIAEYAKVLNDRIEEIKEITGRNDLTLIGHSMGGVVSAYFALNDAKESHTEITDVFTINSPLKGTALHFLAIGPCIRDMAPASEFINRLSTQVQNSVSTRFFHFASDADLIIYPYYSALNMNSPPESCEIESKKVLLHHGHNCIYFSGELSSEIIQTLRSRNINTDN